MGWRMLSPQYPFVYSELPEFVALECTTSPYRVMRYVPERTCAIDSWGGDNAMLTCGHEAPGYAKFCPNCGAKVVIE